MRLSAFPDQSITTEDYAMAARFFNLCRISGVQGSNTDFLICAVAARNRLAIFTTDKDFHILLQTSSDYLPQCWIEFCGHITEFFLTLLGKRENSGHGEHGSYCWA
jgi:predicted nuclease of predicted toxin-antitoxin system